MNYNICIAALTGSGMTTDGGIGTNYYAIFCLGRDGLWYTLIIMEYVFVKNGS